LSDTCHTTEQRIPTYGIADNWSGYAHFFYPKSGDCTTPKRWKFMFEKMHTESKYTLEKQMTVLSESLIEIREHNGTDYKPLVDYQSWRVALINYTVDLLPEKINRMQKHTETDEVFVLMKGRCILFIGEGEEKVTKVHALDMELYKLYNVKKGVWHSHTFSEDARVLIVENRDTVIENSPFVWLSESQCNDVFELTKRLWK
jgi:hypothetical protein